MTETLYLAWRYLTYHRIKTGILVTAIALIVYLPVGLNVLVGQSAVELTARAVATPLLVGARSSRLELVLSSLYFESDTPARLAHGEVDRIAASELADPIPLYVRFQSRGRPIVATTLEYFAFRGLRLVEGRPFAMLGECVVGAAVARALHLTTGSNVVSSPQSVFDLAGVYPVKMPVVGVLAASHSADDHAIFVDVKTAWIIEGLGHGHTDLARADAADAVLARDGNRITANASVQQYNEITAANVGSFHFHGDLAHYPISAVIAVPHDAKSATILMGRYEEDEEENQIVRPAVVMEELLETIFTVRSFIIAAIVVVGCATAATATLVFALSLRLRKRERETLVKIGGARSAVAALLLSEIVFVLAASIVIAAGLTVVTSRFGAAAIRAFVLS